MEDQNSILNEFLERIRNAEKRNEELRKNIQNKKKEIKEFEEKLKSENDNNKKEENNKNKKIQIPTEEQDKRLGEKFLNEFKCIKFNSYEINNNVSEITIEYITQEQFSSLYIMGDFTKWEPRLMKKNKDIFSYKIVLLKGFKYYYNFQSGDQIFIDYNNAYQENPRTLQVQNFIDLKKTNEKSQDFDFQNDMNILDMAQKNYFLSSLEVSEEEMLFLEKFKRHTLISKEIRGQKEKEYDILSNSIYNYYKQKLNYLNPYEGDKLANLKLLYKDRIFAHNFMETKDNQYKYYYKIISITDSFCFNCIKLYDNNNIKIDMKYYNDIRYYYIISFDQISLEPYDPNSKLYYLLSKEESTKILTDYNNNKDNILRAYFTTLNNLKNNTNNTQNQNPLGIINYIRNYGSILVTPKRVEPSGIKADDYEFQYSLNKITKVKNKKEGSYIEFQAIDETAEKAKKPFRVKVYYCIKDNKIKIIHYHILDKDLRDIKINIKEIEKNTDPHTLKKSEEHIKSNELLLLVLESNPLKLYYKGKKVKMEGIKIEENEIYLLESPNTDSFFNKMYVTVDEIGDKMKYDLIEQCNEFTIKSEEIVNGVDVVVSYDNNRNYVTEPIMLGVSPCLLKKISTYEKNNLQKNKNNELKDKNEMDKYIIINQKINEYKKFSKETIDKMKQKEKDDILLNLKEYKEAMNSVMNYIQSMEMWDTIEQASTLNTEIEDLIKLFTNK